MPRKYQSRALFAALLTSTALVGASPARADNIVWRGDFDDFYSQIANWENVNAGGTDRVPTGDDTAFITDGAVPFQPTIQAGQTFSTQRVAVGVAGGTAPELTVNGTLELGASGNIGQLDIGGGTSIPAGAVGTVTVSGAGASIGAAADANTVFGARILVGANGGTGTLNILDGAQVSVGSVAIANDLLISNAATGTVNVDGSGSLLTLGGASGGMTVGVNGTANLNISNGGRVDATGLNISIGNTGNPSGTNATITLTGATSELSANTLQIQGNANTTNALMIGAAAGNVAAAAGQLDVNILSVNAGELVFNHTDTSGSYDVNATIGVSSTQRLGIIRHIAGDTTFSGGISGDLTGCCGFQGQTMVTGGTLRVNGIFGSNLSDSGIYRHTMTVSNGTTLAGSGTIGGNVTVADAMLAPGNSPGTLTFAGDLTLSSASILDFELGNPAGTAGVDSDLINVGGNLTLDGTLNVADAGGFGAGLYRLVNYGGTLTDNGLNIGTTPAGFAATDLTVQTSVANQVNLLVDTPVAPTSGFMWDGPNTAANGSADGGTGTWDATGTNWTIADGSANGAFDPAALLIFAGAPGTVTVDDSAGAIAIQTGMQFAADGYTVTGDAIGLDGATVIRVGDGTSAGAGFTATITSALTGAGSLEKTDLGTLVLTGANSYTGDTTINAGQLFVNGSILGGGDTFVFSGARLGGVGSLAGTTFVNSGGTLAPGNSIGTLTVGNIEFASGSTYTVELNDGGNTAGINNDLISATGTAQINGGTINVTPENGTDDGTTYTPGTTYTVLTSVGERFGEFDSVTDDYAFLDFTDTYDANNVYLTSALVGDGTGTCPTRLTFNQNATCDGLLSIGSGSLYTAVINLSNAEAPIALDQLSGELHASAKAALIEDGRFPREAAMDRLRIALGGVAADNQTQSEKRINDTFAFWGQGFGSWSNWNGDGNAAGLDRSIGGFFLGGDALVMDDFRIGVFGGYSSSSFTVNDRDSSGSAETWHLGAYGGTEIGNLGLRFGGAYGWHDIDTARSVAFTGFSDRLSSSYSARTGQVFGEAGYRFDYGAASFEPFANLAYVHLKTDGFSEAGGEAALTGGGSGMDTTFTTIGLRAETTVDLGGTAARFTGMAGWRHAFGDVTPLATHAFAGGSNFTVAGVPIAKDAFVLDLGASVNLTENAVLGVSYSGQFGSGFTDQGLKANLAVRF